MRSQLSHCIAVALVIGFGLPTSSVAGTAEWTLMIYMNAKNNLEPDALDNFHEIAAVGSSPKVNVLVEMGRPSVHFTSEAKNWSGVLRFRVEKGQEPIPEKAVMDLRSNLALSDLGSPNALQDFISWSIDQYPARKYMLVIWNHGQGWRYQSADDLAVKQTASKRSTTPSPATGNQVRSVAAKTPTVGGFRAVSFDDDTKTFLYNSDIQRVTELVSAQYNKKIDVVGFDACLMSMIETAYGFRNSASFLVASEELEPGAGWNYTPFLKLISSAPATTPLQLSEAVVKSYKTRYGDYHLTTLAVVDLKNTAAAADAISQFADALLSKGVAEQSNVKAAREKLATFGESSGLKTSIDFAAFVDEYVKITSDQYIRNKAAAARTGTTSLVAFNYASALSVQRTGSHGLAIYFPANKSDLTAILTTPDTRKTTKITWSGSFKRNTGLIF